MTIAYLTVNVTPSEGIAHYELRLRKSDNSVRTLNVEENEAVVAVSVPGTYLLVWYLIGATESTLQVSAKLDGKALFGPLTSGVPRGEKGGAGSIELNLEEGA